MKNAPTVFLFSGQGSQTPGMMRELYETCRSFRQELERLDGHAIGMLGTSAIRSFLRDDNPQALERLRVSHPAIFMVQVALARRLMNEGVRPAYVLGASLGELVALVVSGVLGARDGLRLVIQHAQAIERHCPKGGMLAVLDDLKLFREEPSLFKATWLAAEHFSRHFVVSGAPEVLDRLEQELRRRRVTCQRLPVEYAFHSPLVDAAEAELAEIARSLVWRNPDCGFVSCAAGAIVAAPGLHGASEITSGPIRFLEALRSLEEVGTFRYLDLGPSGTMATFAKYALPPHSASTVAAAMPWGRGDGESLRKLIHVFGVDGPVQSPRPERVRPFVRGSVVSV